MLKKYISEDKELMKEWDWDANNKAGLDPNKLSMGSGLKAWWKCSKGHKWSIVIRDKTSRFSKCPYCYGRKVLAGFNDLATTHPKLAKEWNYEKNKSLRPNQVKAGSNKIVWWKCTKGHEWQAKISNRSFLKRGCPVCANHVIIKGKNDLATTHPELAKEWNYEKNAPLLPNQVFGRSAKKVWWICPKGHEYQKSISNRKLSGCPICSKEQQTSFPEQAIFYYLLKYNKNPENRYRIHGIESDIYLKDLNISIEYDGGYYHKNAQKDVNKIIKLNAFGIKTINIRGHRCPKIEVKGALIYQRKSDTEKDLEKAIKFIFSNIDSTITPDINLERDRTIILENALSIEKKNSLANLNPVLLKEWNYEKNGKLKPDFFTSTSGKKVWWKCSKGHEWAARISNRVILNRNCPYCSNQKVLYGYNDVETLHPEIAQEWNYEKNFPLTPRQYITGSNKVVWWKCSKGHEWKTSIASRIRGATLRGVIKGTQCPYCSNQKIQVGFNDLATTHPEIAKKWNYEKNAPLLPTQVVAGSNKKVWWKCSNCGHEWRTSVNNMTQAGRHGCAICSNIEKGKAITRNRVKEIGSLAETMPELAKQWHPTKNGTLTPRDITAGTGKLIWWLCPKCNHEWQATPNSRKKGIGCPCCSGRVPKAGVNDLVTTHPQLAKEWHPTRNKNLSPNMVSYGSNKKIWWLCSKGHSYAMTVNHRSFGGNCPYCSNSKVLEGFNDLATKFPKIAKEWCYEKNAPLTPKDVSPGSGKKVWWICPKGHDYEMTISHRSTGGGCPYCANKRVWVGFNDLETKFPKIATEWSVERNAPLTPKDVLPGSERKVWWKCHNCGHVWHSKIYSRTQGGKCPNCHGLPQLPLKY